uniref:ARAD1D25036p n=1 Tax=Blastobotrys adeninivorans TaxID=409370 RepID=A0A060TGP9_BLAAD
MVSLSTFALSVLASVAAAASNAIHKPSYGQVVNAGSTFTIEWDATGGDKVNLVLRDGKSDALKTVGDIAKGVDNTGSYDWEVDSDLDTNTDYSIMIENQSNSSDINYSPYFTVLATGAGYTSSSNSSSVTTSGARASSAASGSGVASASASATGSSSHNASASSTGNSTTTSDQTNNAAGFFFGPGAVVAAVGALLL